MSLPALFQGNAQHLINHLFEPIQRPLEPHLFMLPRFYWAFLRFLAFLQKSA